jgi:hypothetical protein
VAGRKKTYDAGDGINLASFVRPKDAIPLEKTDLDKVVVRRGRRRALTSLEIDVFCRVLDQPATFEQACAAIAVPVRTMHDWIAKGREDDCDDPIMLELAAKYGAVESSGYRDWAMRNLLDHAKDDARAAIKAAEILVKGANTAKNMKVEMEVSAGGSKSDVNWALATDEEMSIANAYERVVARLRAIS